MKKIIFFILSFFLFTSISYANVTVKDEKIEKKTTISLEGNTVVVDGDISFPSGMRIPYDFHIVWDVTIGDHAKIVWDMTVDGDINVGNSVVVYKTLSGNNISTWNRLVASFLKSTWDLQVNGKATITGWVEVWWDFEAGSDLILYWNSSVEWDMKVELDTTITWTLYVYWDLRSKERFEFADGKLKIYWDFRTLKESEITGNYYVYGTKWRRSYYTNKIKINYLLENNKYRGFMWKIDPILSYNLSSSQLKYIHAQIDIKQYKIEQKKKQISLFPYNYSQDSLNNHIEELKNMETNLIQFVEKYISLHSRDIQEWKIIQLERENELKTFLYQYVY